MSYSKVYEKRVLAVLLTIIMVWAMVLGLSENKAMAANYSFSYYEMEDGNICVEYFHDGAGSIIIPNQINGKKVTTLRGACYGCSGVTSISIPESVTEIEPPSIFVACENLKNINVDTNNKYYKSINGVLFNKEGTSLLFFPEAREGSYTIPNGVDTIADSAFLRSKLKTISIPDSVEMIEEGAFWCCEKLKSVNIPSRVKSIESNTFDDCASLEKIIIPDGITRIGNNAFSNCRSLKEISIPDSVTYIEEFAFSSCYKLEKVKMPPKLSKEMIAGLFLNCFNLKSITIPEGVEGVNTDSFLNCTALSYVTIPVSVQSIQWGAFSNCNALSDVYYTGTRDQWNNIRIDTYNNLNAPLINAKIHFLDEMIAKDSERYVDVPFRFKSDFLSNENKINSYVTEKCMNFKTNFSDEWLFETGDGYNATKHELAKTSLCLAMAGYGMHDGKADTSYSQSGQINSTVSAATNILALLKKLQFKNEYVHYPDPEINSIGYVISSKNVKCGDEEMSLINITVRGGGYNEEWGGNFQVSNTKKHDGFSKAADQVLAGLEQYLLSKGPLLLDNKRIWITGYSRGGATANLVAAALDDGRISGITKRDVIAFCFECPKTTTESKANASSTKYSNIINIINPIDFVPKIPMRNWGYTRYGQLLAVPYDSGPGNYSSLKSRMQNTYNTLLNDNGISSKDYTKESWGNVNVMNTAINTLSSEVPKNDYVKRAQNSAVLTGKEIGSTGKPKNQSIFEKWWGKLESVNVYQQIYTDIFLVICKTSGIKTAAAELIVIPGTAVNPTVRSLLKEKGREIGFTHYAELELSWLYSMNWNNISHGGKIKEAIFNCPVDVEVFDSNGNSKGHFFNDEYSREEDGVPGYVDSNGQKILCLPADEEYDISIQATDKGDFTYTIVEKDIDDGEVYRVVSYQDLKLTKGEQFTSDIQAIPESGKAEYTLVKNGKKCTPDVEQIGETVQNYTVRALADGNGAIAGGGVFVSGEFAKVTAVPNEEAEFFGWYNGEDLVTQETEYRFPVDQDIELTAKFTPIEEPKPENPFGDVNDSNYFYDSVLWAVNHNPQITKGTDGTHFSPGGACTRAQAVTFLWRACGCEKVTDVENPFMDVKENTFYYDAVLWAYKNNITKGTDNNHFSPEDTCNRGQIVTFLWRSIGQPSSDETVYFKDVLQNAYYNDAVKWALEMDVTKGTSTETFSPIEDCTRGQIVTFLYRAMK